MKISIIAYFRRGILQFPLNQDSLAYLKILTDLSEGIDAAILHIIINELPGETLVHNSQLFPS